jgi:hypothetical protein
MTKRGAQRSAAALIFDICPYAYFSSTFVVHMQVSGDRRTIMTDAMIV